MQNNEGFFSPSLSVEDLMHLACSSVFCGGGTNQELAHHCLYECKGDIMVSAAEQSTPTGCSGISVNNRKMTGRYVLQRSGWSQIFS